jgi:hypothetical protein
VVVERTTLKRLENEKTELELMQFSSSKKARLMQPEKPDLRNRNLKAQKQKSEITLAL